MRKNFKFETSCEECEWSCPVCFAPEFSMTVPLRSYRGLCLTCRCTHYCFCGKFAQFQQLNPKEAWVCECMPLKCEKCKVLGFGVYKKAGRKWFCRACLRGHLKKIFIEIKICSHLGFFYLISHV